MYKQPFLAPAPFERQTVPFHSPFSHGLNDPIVEQNPYETKSLQSPFIHYVKPKQPENWFPTNQYQTTYENQPYDNQAPHFPENAYQSEYFSPEYNPLSQPNFQSGENLDELNYNSQSQVNNQLLAQFQNSEGQLDIDKMINTVGQLANTYHQVAPIIKQFSSLIRLFR